MMQINPVSGGIIAGALHVVLSPDHLCTIVTLSACQGAEAFWFGVRWASGHLAGMLILGTVFACLNTAQISAFNFEMYEHYAYYCVGFLLMFMGGYFIINAEKYFDAEWAPKQASCACHSHPDSGYGSGDTEANHDQKQTAMEKLHGIKPSLGMRESGSILVGFVQGIACPAGVVGMVFLRQYNAVEMVIFLSIFFTVTTLAMGLLAMTYGMLTKSCISSQVLGRNIYYASCCLSLTLGAAWIFLNATNRLDALLGHDHGAHGHSHSHDHGAHTHDHGAHGHEHHHHHM